MAAIAVNCDDVCLLLEKRGVWPECEDESPRRSAQTKQCQAEGRGRDGEAAPVKAQTLGAGASGADIGAGDHGTADMS